MGRWGWGILDGDGPLDEVGSLADTVRADLARYARTRPGPRTPARVGAAVGVILQVAPEDVGELGDPEVMVKAIQQHAEGLKTLGDEASSLLSRIASGAAGDLAERHGDRSGDLLEVLGGYLDHVREPSLFEHPLAKAYVQKVAERCASRVEAGLAQQWAGMYDEDDWLGALGFLLILEPWSLPRERALAWRDRFASGVRSLVAKHGEDPDVKTCEKELFPNVKQAFELVLARSG